MLIGAIADDFTGASDLANTLAKGGMSTVQFVGSGGRPIACDAGVVALKTRTVPVADAIALSLAAARWLLEQGCQQIIFKYCSTFDSTREGNIGPVAEALLDLMGADVAVVCPAFPATGRRVFMGHLFVGDRLLNQSGMEKHPLTPMTDPDLRRWLRHQTRGEVGSIALPTVRSGDAALAAAFANEERAGRRLVVADAVDDDDLLRLGRAVAGHRLVTGGSGIALGLPANFDPASLIDRSPFAPRPTTGRGVALCGSCSGASQAQVARHLVDHQGFAVDPAALMTGDLTVRDAADWVMAQPASPIVYSTADPQTVLDAQQRFGRHAVASGIERFFADLARELADRGMRRIAVGGGETSGAVVEALGIENLRIGPEIDPGVPSLVADRGGPLGLALKSGNFGAVDFFAKALRQMGTT